MPGPALTRINTHVADAQARLTQKYRGKEGIEAIVAALTTQAQAVENALWGIMGTLNIDAAQGSLLDLIGTVVGVARGINNDAGYRAILRGAVGENTSDGTVPMLESILRDVFLSDGVFTQDGSAPGLALSGIRPLTSLMFGVSNPRLDPTQFAAAIARFLPATASGVGVHAIYTFDRTRAFAMAGPQAWVQGFGDLNDASVGGAMAGVIYTREAGGGDGLRINNPNAGYPPLPQPPPPPVSAQPPPPVEPTPQQPEVPPEVIEEQPPPNPAPNYTYSYLWKNGLVGTTQKQSYGTGTGSTEADSRESGGLADVTTKLGKVGTPSAFCYTTTEQAVQQFIGITADVYADAPGGVVRLQIDDGPYDAPPEFPPANGLFADGNKLKNSAGARIKLHGVNVPSLGYSVAGDPNQYSTPGRCFPNQSFIDVVKKAIDDWKVNFLRIPLSQDIWLNTYGNLAQYKTLLNSIISYAASKNVYVDMELHQTDGDEDFNMPYDISVTVIGQMAAYFKTFPNVIIGVHNEPRNVSYAIWRNGGTATHDDGSTYHTPGMQAMVNAVRSNGFTNAVTVSGLDYAFDLRGVANGYAITDNNVIYEAHVYPVKSTTSWWDTNITTPAGQYPILIGEFGADPNSEPSPYGAPAQFLEVLRKWIAKNNYNYCAWAIDAASDPCLISDWCYTLTPYFGVPVVPWLGPANPLVSQSFQLPTAGWQTLQFLFTDAGAQNIASVSSQFLNLQIFNASGADTGKVRVNNVGMIVNASPPAVVDGYQGTDNSPAAPTTGKALYVKGNKFYRASDNSVWMGRGCNSCDIRFDNKAYNAPDGLMATELKRRIGWAMGQGVDFIRLCLQVNASQDDVTNDADYLNAIKDVVKYIGDQGGWCLLSVWYHYTCTPEPIGQLTQATINTWKKLASSFRQSTHVMYGLCNEPRNNNTQAKRQAYLDVVNQCISAIRTVESNEGGGPHIIVVPGPDSWARKVDWFVNNRATDAAYPYVNSTTVNYIAYELHNYEAQSDWASYDGMAAAQAAVPLIIGEFAPDNNVSTQTQSDTAALMAFCNTNKVPYCGWTFDFRTPPDMLQDLESDATGSYGQGTPLKWTDWGLQFINLLRAQKGLSAVNKNGV